MTLTLRFASTIAALLLATLSFRATAQIDGYLCNGSPGERQVGVAPPLGTPICVIDPAKQAAPQQSAPTMDTESLSALVYLFRVNDAVEKAERLMNDPVFKRLADGYWSYLETNKEGASADAPCVATFFHLSGVFSLMATGGPDSPIVGTFRGASIPRPTKERPLTVKISSDAQPAATVPVYNYADPDSDLGTLAFGGGNNLKQAMGGMHESEEITVTLDGTEIFSGLYRDGGEMKKRFSRCVESRK